MHGFSSSSANVILFISGAFIASFSWQSFLASISGVVHKHISAKLQLTTFMVGNFVIIGFGVAILLGLYI
jgi:hypothetical protein